MAGKQPISGSSPKRSDGGGSRPAASIVQTLNLLECGVCTEPMLPPIYQCKEGHTLCNACSDKLAQCPACRDDTINIRNRALENLAEGLDGVPCKFQRHGCKLFLRYMELGEHEAKCTWKPLTCPALYCSFQGTSEELVLHLVSEHQYHQVHSNRINLVCSKENVTRPPPAAGVQPDDEQYLWQNQVYSCYDRHFVLRIHRKVECDPQYYISVIGLHTRHHSNRYSIAIQGNHRKYTFEGPVWSLRKGFGEVERVRDCLILPENIALFLSGGKGSENDLGVINLTVSGDIMPP